ncbi:hypothetical protein Taro_008477 [Colocasia esculenta]|uniref:Sodium/metabolite cotransporter BASS4, chloroplastic n=1 Tax=Colocasia esculenta TaxID=4460 RepID=A0A843TXQ4_COLES|nr:hypothetical protein [Colocasia esculenta]
MASVALRTLALRPPAAGISSSRPRIAPPGAYGARLSGPPLRLLPRIRGSPRQIPLVVKAAGGAYEVSGGGGELSGASAGESFLSWAKPLLKFVTSNFLPLALLCGVALGFLNPTPGCLAHKYSLSKLSTFGIFFISGIMLRSGDIGAAAEAWPAGMFGLASILLFTPFFSKIVMQLQLSPQEFLAKGNSALALAITVLTNLFGILLIPFSLSNFIGKGGGLSVPTMQLMKSLVVTLLVPLIIGKVFRDSFSRVAEYVDQNRQLFSMMSAVFLSLVPWIQVSRSRTLLLAVQPAVFLAAVVMGILLHLTLLTFNSLALRGLSLVSGGDQSVFAKKENARALILVASQKTLPVMVAVVEQLGGALGQSGLLVLPCVAAHINQIIVDSFLVNMWLRKDSSSPKQKEA